MNAYGIFLVKWLNVVQRTISNKLWFLLMIMVCTQCTKDKLRSKMEIYLFKLIVVGNRSLSFDRVLYHILNVLLIKFKAFHRLTQSRYIQMAISRFHKKISQHLCVRRTYCLVTCVYK